MYFDQPNFEEKAAEAKQLSPPDIKIIMLGDSAVGKSKIVERFLLNDYEERYNSTYALTLYRKNHNVEGWGTPVKIDLWDTAG